MAVEPELLDLLTQTVTLKPPVSRNAHNEWTFGPSEYVRCRVTPKLQQFTDNAGKARISTGSATLAVFLPVTPDWYMLLPTGERTYIVSVDLNYDEQGEYNTVIYFGGAKT